MGRNGTLLSRLQNRHLEAVLRRIRLLVAQSNGLGKNQSNKTVIAKFDLILIATNHFGVDYQEIGEWRAVHRR
jgi:hypothetical protein